MSRVAWNKGLRTPVVCEHKDRPRHCRGLCKSCYNKQILHANPEWMAKKHAANREWAKNNPLKVRLCHIKNQYGLSPERHKKLYDSQGGCCAVCNKPQAYSYICVDHNHETGEVRGLLCRNYNAALGNFHDSIDLLDKAIAYLKRKDGGL